MNLPLFTALLFLLANVAILRLILALNRRKEVIPTAPPITAGESCVDPVAVLSWEFEYARITASEAMAERHTIVNFYLLIASLVTSGVVALLAQETGLPTAIGAALFWVLVGIGWIDFLAIIRLRQAWHGSAQAMNRIKRFSIEHAHAIEPATLRTAFLWQPQTLSTPDRPWTIYFYAAMLIALLNSVAYVAGGALLSLQNTLAHPWRMLGPLALLGIAFFAFHIWLYSAFLQDKPKHDESDQAEKQQAKASSMPARQTAPDNNNAWVKILEETEEYTFGKLFRVIHAQLQFRCFDGRLSEPITRINFARGDSVGVLLYDPAEDAVVLVRQFRYPVYASLAPTEQVGEGARLAWLLEIVAGVKEADYTVQEIASKELLEEAGYTVKSALQPITTIYPSPGGASERIRLFWAEVDHRQPTAIGGGLVAEGEDSQIVVLSFGKALQMVSCGEISDAKTIIAPQYLAMPQSKDCPHPYSLCNVCERSVT